MDTIVQAGLTLVGTFGGSALTTAFFMGRFSERIDEMGVKLDRLCDKNEEAHADLYGKNDAQNEELVRIKTAVSATVPKAAKLLRRNGT